jgi:hypothetical protein
MIPIARQPPMGWLYPPMPIAPKPPKGWRYPGSPVAAIQLRVALSTTFPGANCSSM